MGIRIRGRDRTRAFAKHERRGCRLESACACTGLLFFLPLVSAPESRFGRYWANQGLIILLIQLFLLAAWFLGGGLLWLLSLIPYVGIAFSILRTAFGILMLAIAVCYIGYGVRYAACGRAKDVPLFGHLRLIGYEK